jgi:hypothetical protein
MQRDVLYVALKLKTQLDHLIECYCKLIATLIINVAYKHHWLALKLKLSFWA